MTDNPVTLAQRLRELRESTERPTSQTQIASALAVSRQLVSYWESGQKVPPVGRLDEYARLFASVQADPRALRLPKVSDLPSEQMEAYHLLREELAQLRETESARQRAVSVGPEQAGWFWRFRDDLPITIIGSKQPAYVVSGIPEADRHHPDYTETLHHADADAEIDLYGHLRASNPGATVNRIITDQVKNRLVSGHVVVIGGGVVNPWAEWFSERMNIPVGVASPELTAPEDSAASDLGAEEWQAREFRVTPTDDMDESTADEVLVEETDEGEEAARTLVYRPRFEGSVKVTDRDGSLVEAPSLFSDVALIARMPSPFTRDATVTLLAGLFSRGTYGAVRAFTDPSYLETNENYLADRLGDGTSDRFFLLHRVVCDRRVRLSTTADLRSDEHRLLEWFE